MRKRWERLLLRLKLRTALVVCLIHLGLAISAYALIELRLSGAPAHLVYLATLGICGIYGGILLGTAFIVFPILSWVKTARKLLRWKEWILDELPGLIAQVPKWIDTFKEVQAMIFPKSTNAPSSHAARPSATRSSNQSAATNQTEDVTTPDTSLAPVVTPVVPE